MFDLLLDNGRSQETVPHGSLREPLYGVNKDSQSADEILFKRILPQVYYYLGCLHLNIR